MQAIATLHAQLNLATEKLDHAQKALTAQEKEIQDLEEEGRLRWEEVEELTEMLNNIQYDEKVGNETLDTLKLQTHPLKAAYEQSLGAVEVLPFAFQRLSEEFVVDSKKKMNQIEDLLSLAIRENFWRNKNKMNSHHLNASKLRLKKQTLNLQQSLVIEENALNRQLAEEESALSLIQASIEAIERKNKQLTKGNSVSEVARGSFSYPKSSIGGTDESDRSHCAANYYNHGGICSPVSIPSIETFKASSYKSPPIMDSTGDKANSKCYGCHKFGHYMDKCPESYKCKTCNMHHHNSKSCPKIQSVDSLGGDLFTGEIPRGVYASNITPPSRLTDSFDSTNYGPYSNSIGRSSYPPNKTSTHIPQHLMQQMRQPDQQSCQDDGHVKHTITHVVTEEVLQGDHSGGLRDQGQGQNERVEKERDDRPWFQVMKRRRSATATVSSNQNADTVFDYSDDYSINDAYNDNYSNSNYPSSAGKHEVSIFPVTAPQASSTSSYEGFRSGLEILLDSENKVTTSNTWS